MAIEVRLPRLGKTMEEGTIVTYSVKVGDKVEKGDCIFELETNKATLEVESPADGEEGGQGDNADLRSTDPF